MGFNTNVPYRGRLYHVQTEDNGPRNPVIVTLLYYQGAILASKKTSYAHLLEEPQCEEKVQALMKAQHKGMIKELLRGSYTGELDGTSERGESLEGQGPQAPQEGGKLRQSLDDVLLEFILRKHR